MILKVIKINKKLCNIALSIVILVFLGLFIYTTCFPNLLQVQSSNFIWSNTSEVYKDSESGEFYRKIEWYDLGVEASFMP